jgi:aspartate oxidase
MTDTEQAAYDAAQKKIEQLKDEMWEYMGLVKKWRNITVRLMDIEQAQRRIEGVVE